MAKAPKKKTEARNTVVVEPERDLVAEVVAKHRRPRRKAKKEPIFHDPTSWIVLALSVACFVGFMVYAVFYSHQ